LNSILVLGWGNPIFGDDGLGIKVAERLRKMELPPWVRVESCTLSPLSVVRKMINHKKVIIIDILQPRNSEDRGKVLKVSLSEFCNSLNLVNPHSISLPAALEIYKAIYPEQVPNEIVAIGVCVDPYQLKVGEGLSKEVELKLDEVVKLVLEEIRGERSE